MEKLILAFVGMPGAGKTEATFYLQQKGFPFVRFGQITDEGIKELGLPPNQESERFFREKIRKELGMEAYAIKARPKIEEVLQRHTVIIIDGLYSWEEYIFLKKQFSNLILIHIFAEPKVRYQRLSQRPIRPLSQEESRQRDIAELEKLNKGGPIAIADYLIENNSHNLNDFYAKIDGLLARLGVKA